MPETKIVRTEIITVKSTVTDQYGNLIVTDTQGKEHKIGKKRKNLFAVFQRGAEVKLGYAEYMDKPYIATAEQTGNHAPETPVVNPTATAVKNTAKPDTRDRSMALSYSKDVVVATMNAQSKATADTFGTIIKGAAVFERYLSGDLVISDEEYVKMVDKLTRKEPKNEQT